MTANAETPKRVLVIDDSAAMCGFLAKVLNRDPQLEVVGSAPDPYAAREAIKQLAPDVITLDVEMPKMDGLTFLRNLMRLRPMPVIMVSSLTAAGASLTLEALEVGAIDFVVKRHPGSGAAVAAYEDEIRSKVRAAAVASLIPHQERTRFRYPPQMASLHQRLLEAGPAATGIDQLVAVASSTGGPQALMTLLKDSRAERRAMVIAQHVTAAFTSSLAARLNKLSPFDVQVASHGCPVRPGQALICPGDQNLRVIATGEALHCQLSPTDANQLFVPSADKLFDSVARAAGAASLGLVLTGMGTDGARGVQSLRTAGAVTIAQDEPSSAVWGMPGAAVATGAVDVVLPLQHLAAATNRLGS